MMKNRSSTNYFLAMFFPGILLLAALPAFPRASSLETIASAPSSSNKASNKASNQAKDKARDAPPSEGEQKFEQHCSRCHDAPQGFSPRISGTILRHMRVRASLSKEDEQSILRFLNP